MDKLATNKNEFSSNINEMTRQKGTDFACDMCYKYGKNGYIGRTINLWSKRLTH